MFKFGTLEILRQIQRLICKYQIESKLDNVIRLDNIMMHKARHAFYTSSFHFKLFKDLEVR
jgi:hypothetical protein